MEDWQQIIKSIAVTAENVSTVGRRFFEMAIDRRADPALDAYWKRVKNRKRAGEIRPEWDLLGRVAFDGSGNRCVTEMDGVPQSLKELMDRLIRTGGIKPGPCHTVKTSDENHLYMLEIGTGWPTRNAMIFVFWQRPA
ncbi:MAG: hypothetical protein OXR67_04010 [Chloroflexota bacterium]|nr:hypothetical protein [Chloroflexota bacterium]